MSRFPKHLDRILQRRWELGQHSDSSSADELLKLDESVRERYEQTVAPFVVDMAGFTETCLAYGIMHYLSMIQKMRTSVWPVIEKHGGTVVKVEADNLFAYFPSPSRATLAAKDMHRRLYALNDITEDIFRIQISIGVGYGPTLILPGDMWGSDFNLTSKLGEDIARHSEVLFTEAARQKVRSKKHVFKRRPVVLGGRALTAYALKVP